MPDQPSVFDPPASYQAQENLRALPRMLMGGTPRLHAECEQWLPPWSKEEESAEYGSLSPYRVRVSRAVVEPFYERAIKRHVATCLGKSIVLEDDVPADIRGAGDGEDGKEPAGGESVEGWWENIDLRGNNGDVFLRAVVEDAVGEGGFSTVLVDHPEVPPGFKLSDVQSANMRPYWRHYKACDLLEAVPEVINGRERPSVIRLRECGDGGQERVRVLVAAQWNQQTQSLEGFVTWQLWEKQKDREGNEVSVMIGSGTMEPHQEIPLAPLYFNRTGFFAGRPPYLQLAYLNLNHIQQESDLKTDLRMTSGAALFRAGGTKEEFKQRVSGPSQLLWSEDSSARAEWLERSGTGAKVYMDYQGTQEGKMERIGNEPHIQRTGNETATAAAIDTAKARTEIQVDVLAIKDFVERLLGLTAAYRGQASGGSVVIHTPPAYSQHTIEEMTMLMDAANQGYIQRFRVAEALKAQGILPDDVDPETEAELAKQDASPPPTAAGILGAPVDAATGSPDAHLARVQAAVAAANGGAPAVAAGSDAPPPPGAASEQQQQPATASS